MQKYQPVDLEAYSLSRKIKKWAMQYRFLDPKSPITRKNIREYLTPGHTSNWSIDIEKRIFQEMGRRGAFARKRNQELKKKRERLAEKKRREAEDRDRQGELDLILSGENSRG